MRRGTTPLVSLTVYGYDLTGSAIYATIRQGQTKVTKTGEDVAIEVVNEDTIVTFKLTQTDTLSFEPGKAKVQIRWIYADGEAPASNISEIQIDDVLLDGVIAYE